MGGKQYVKEKIIFIILAIGVSIVAFTAFGRYGDNKENSSSITQQVSAITIENKKLTKENIEETMTEFSNKKGKESDEVYYLSYKYLRNALQDLTSTEDPYSKMYGMTISEIIEEAKEDMKKEEITIEDFKKGMKEAAEKSNGGTIYLNEQN